MLKINYDKLKINMNATTSLMLFDDYIKKTESHLNDLKDRAVNDEQIKKIEKNLEQISDLKLHHKNFSDMLWENIDLIESIVDNDTDKLNRLREKYGKHKNN